MDSFVPADLQQITKNNIYLEKMRVRLRDAKCEMRKSDIFDPAGET
jgi:hypothetical protein